MSKFNSKFVSVAAGVSAIGIGLLLSGCDGKCPFTKNTTPASAPSASTAPTATLPTQEDPWMNTFELAQSQAKINHKPILLSFSGSDWCSWCIKLEKEVFSQPEFLNWAKENVVLYNADFPRNGQQDAALRATNDELAAKYQIEGYPTVLLIDADGNVLARTGYQRGGAASYVAHLEKLLK